MKKKIGIILALVMLFSVITALPAAAALTPISGTVLNDQLSFKIEGKAVVPVGDDGTPVLPISYNGTTYLPVRAMGYLLGLGIDWDGGTNTVLITSSATKTAPPATGGGPGWYLTRWEYIKDPGDTVDTGGKVGRFAGGDTYTDYLEGKGEKNDFTIVTARKLSNGTVAASGHVTTTWTDPPEYFGANDRPTVTVNRTADSTWGINAFSISFDMHDINPGSATMGKINFASPDGQTHVQAYKGTMQMQKAKTGKAGDKMAVIFHLNWYGFKYYYEWRD